MCTKLHYSEPRHPTLREWETTVRTKRGIGTGEGVGDKKGVREARERQEWETCDLIIIILIMFKNMLSIHSCEHSGNYCGDACVNGNGGHDFTCGNARCNSGEHGQYKR